MRILICNSRLTKRTGTEIVTRDFALGLKSRGHEVEVLTAKTGAIAEEIRNAGVPVETDASMLPFAPDVIHTNHEPMITLAASAFPETPMMFQNHAPGDVIGAAVNNPACIRHFGISQLACDAISRATGRPTDGIIGNFVDLSLFKMRQSPLPDKPRRWLVVAEKKRGLRHFAKICLLGAIHRATVTGVGPRLLRVIENVPEIASKYDLVFASARCALEASAAGAGVIITDYRGSAGFLKSANVEEAWQKNLGYSLFDRPSSLAALNADINQWDPRSAQAASQWLRDNASLEAGLYRLEKIYRNMILGN